MFHISPIGVNDNTTLKGWWKAHGMRPTEVPQMPPTSWMVYYGERDFEGDTLLPVAAISLYLTNCKELALIENLVSNPRVSDRIRREGVTVMVEYMETYAKAHGVKNLICMTNKNGLKKRYEGLGYKPGLKGLTMFCKGVA